MPPSQILLSAGAVLCLCLTFFILVRYWNQIYKGTHPVSFLTFVAILFTSGLDIGFILLPLTEFADYQNNIQYPEYMGMNPLAIEFGFYGFFVWLFYFVTCFYFCVLEPRLHFFDIPFVKFLYQGITISTCAFTAYLLWRNLPWYVDSIVPSDEFTSYSALFVLVIIGLSVCSSMSLRILKALSVSSSLIFIILFIVLLPVFSSLGEFYSTFSLLGNYFTHLERFILPLNSHHAFYLFWWFSWSLMIGQFVSRFVGGMKTYQLLCAMLVVPSIPIALWLTLLYQHVLQAHTLTPWLNSMMVITGIIFVINSLDSLIRIYSDHLNLTVERLGRNVYIAGHTSVLFLLMLLFQYKFMSIELLGSLVILILFALTGYVGRFLQRINL